jgi:signal transduction histidine kinase
VEGRDLRTRRASWARHGILLDPALRVRLTAWAVLAATLVALAIFLSLLAVPDTRVVLLVGLALAVVVVLVGYGTWHGVGRALRPVNEIRAELDEITATDLERRVPVPGHNDEIARLAESVNATLDRLEGSVARLRGFVSDVSHELRSPLTGLRMELELALSDPAESYPRSTLESLLESAGRLQGVLDDLLALARLEYGPQILRDRVELQELADQSVLARPRRARFTVEGGEPVVVRGGRAELGRLLVNLLDNADRHAAAAVTVTVCTEAGPGAGRTAVVEVYDDGRRIAPEERERVFERFTRLAEGRHADAGGTGLSLSISRDIAVAHGGSLIITDRADGLTGARFILRLPVAEAAETGRERG